MKGSPPYVANYVSNYSIQFMIFETLTDYYRKNYGKEKDEWMIFFKSFLSGLIGSAFSNCFDFLAI